MRMDSMLWYSPKFPSRSYTTWLSPLTRSSAFFQITPSPVAFSASARRAARTWLSLLLYSRPRRRISLDRSTPHTSTTSCNTR